MTYTIKRQQIILNEEEGWSFQFLEENDFVKIVYFENALEKITEIRVPKDCLNHFIIALARMVEPND